MKKMMYHVTTLHYDFGHKIGSYDVQNCKIRAREREIDGIIDSISPRARIKSSNSVKSFNSLAECLFYAMHFVGVKNTKSHCKFYKVEVNLDKVNKSPLAFKELLAIRLEEKKEITGILRELWNGHNCWNFFEYFGVEALVKESIRPQLSKEDFLRNQDVYFDDLYNAIDYFK